MTTVESSDGRKLVTAWRDADGGAMKATAGAGSRPWIGTTNGLPYVDFGSQRSGTPPSSSDLSGFLAWSSRLTNIREVFLVYSDYPGSAHSFFLGDGSGDTFHFHRNQLKLFNNQYASANVKNGLKEVDGVERTIDYELPSGFHIIHLRTTGNVTASSFARDRSNINYGGQRLQEVVVYTSTLTDAQAGSVYNYLKAKWFTIKPDTLVIDGIPEQVGSPDPAYGMRTGLAAGDSFAVSCGATVVTNGSTECIYQGWKLYDQDYNLLTNGTETSFTYTHPSPAAGRMFEWQWKTRPVGADATDLLPTLCLTFDGQSLANTGSGSLTMSGGVTTYVESEQGYALDTPTCAPYGSISGVFAANRDSAIAAVAKLGTKSTGILFHFKNSNGNTSIMLRRGSAANQIVLTENNSSSPLITVNGIESGDTEYHLYVVNILSDRVDLYVDGVLAGTTATTPRASDLVNWQFGGRHGGVISGEALCGGPIDDLRVYSSALSTDQMIALGDSMGLYSAFRIQPIPTIEYNPLSMPYPEVIVSDRNTGEILSEGSDYEVAYSNANYVGTATVYVTGRGSYTGEKTKVNYQIVSDYFLPSGYRQLEYIRSTGTQYIKTGMLPTANTTVELKFNAKGVSNDTTFFGQGWGNSNFLFIRQNDVYKFFGTGNTGTTVGELSDNDLTAYVTTNDTFVIDYGDHATTTQVSRAASTSNAFNIFADNGGSHKGSWTFYSMKIATNGVLQRDYVPAERESDGAIGLYDRANNVFYANQGTGAFVAGRYVDEVLKIDPIPTQVTDFGLAVEPSPVVRSLMTGELLSEGTDYEVSYANNTTRGTAEVTVSGLGTYAAFTNTMPFEICLPVAAGMKPLEYVELTGSQYVQLGLYPTNHQVEVDFQTVTYYNGAFILGTDYGGNYFHFTEYNNIYTWGKNGSEGNSGSLKVDLNRHQLVYNRLGDNAVVIDGTVLASGAEIKCYNNRYNLNLGRRQSTTYKGRYYFVRITNRASGKVELELVPAMNADGVAGFYDRVSGRFLRSNGSAQLVAGPEVSCSDFSVAPIPIQHDWSGGAAHPTVGSRPALVVSNLVAGTELREGVDYTVAYLNNVSNGVARAVVTGTGAYAGQRDIVCFRVYNSIFEEYTPLHSIETTGFGSGIGLDYVHKTSTWIRVVSYAPSDMLASANHQSIVGSRRYLAHQDSFYFEYRYGGSNRPGWSRNGEVAGGNNTYPYDEWVETVCGTNNGLTASWRGLTSGKSGSLTATGANVAGATPLVLFGINTFNGWGYNYGIDVTAGDLKVATFEIYEGETLVRDFKPVRRLADGVVGVYDPIENQFFANRGSGAIVAGREYSPLDIAYDIPDHPVIRSFIPAEQLTGLRRIGNDQLIFHQSSPIAASIAALNASSV